MVEHPVTFITGFGWDVYWSCRSLLAAQPLSGAVVQPRAAWVCCAAPTCCSPPSIAHVAPSAAAAPPYRGQLIAFVLGGVGVATAVFFVDLYAPWYYFWMYARFSDATGVVCE